MFKMTETRSAIAQFNEWKVKLETAVSEGTGNDLEQTTRMVRCLGAIIAAYHPYDLPKAEIEQIRPLFDSATGRIDMLVDTEDYRGGTPEHYLGFRRNIHSRRDGFDEVFYPEITSPSARQKS